MAQLPQNLSGSIARIAKQAVGKDWQLYSILLHNWREIVGPDFAERIVPVKLVFPPQQRTGGCLTVSLPRGLTMAAQYGQPRMLARINGFLGHAAVERMIFVHDLTVSKPNLTEPELKPETRHKIAAAASVIADEALRQSLQDFGAVLAAQRPPK